MFGDRTAINEQVRACGLLYILDIFTACFYYYVADRLIRRVTSAGILHTPRCLSEAFVNWSWETDSSECTSLLDLRRRCMGCGNVDIPRTRRDDPTRHVQLHELPLQRLREMEELADIGMEEQVILGDHCPLPLSISLGWTYIDVTLVLCMQRRDLDCLSPCRL